MNVVLIIVSFIFILCAVSGLVSGFVKKASGIVSFILAGVLTAALLPSVSSWLRSSTPLYDLLQRQCAQAGETIAQNALSGGIQELTGSGTGLSGAGTSSSDSASSDSAMSGNSSASSGDSSSAGTAGSQGSAADQVFNADGSVNRTYIKSVLQQYGYDPSLIDSMSDDQIRSLLSQYGVISAGVLSARGKGVSAARYTEYPSADSLKTLCTVYSETPVLMRGGRETEVLRGFHNIEFETVSKKNDSRKRRCFLLTMEGTGSDSSENSSDTAQSASVLSSILNQMNAADKRKFIEALPIPKSMQEQLETFNNEEGYQKLGASDFASYITSYFASLILNVITYFVTLLIAWLIIRLILRAAGIFARLPVIRTADRLLGLVIGLLQGLLIVWTLFVILSLFSATGIGQTLMGQVYSSPFLELLYNSNLFLKSASSALKGIL